MSDTAYLILGVIALGVVLVGVQLWMLNGKVDRVLSSTVGAALTSF